MTSQACLDWWGKRARGLDNLESAHAKVTGGTVGRQWLTEDLNHALIVRLASQFQGFARDLHDEAIAAFLLPKEIPTQAYRQIFRTQLENRRDLSMKNAHPSSLGNDFARLGMTLWDDLYARYPSKGKRWNERLTLLNQARNAIAHNDPEKIYKVKLESPLTFRSYRSWRSMLNGLVIGLDTSVAAYLKQVTGNAPW